MIVTEQDQYATVLGRAGQITMTERIAGAINAGAFAVPHGEYAIVAVFTTQAGLLGAPYRGCGQVFVDAGLEHNLMLLQVSLCL